ncbi:hypothetical protein Tco_0100215, partial [Tanacetum coccineum]
MKGLVDKMGEVDERLHRLKGGMAGNVDVSQPRMAARVLRNSSLSLVTSGIVNDAQAVDTTITVNDTPISFGESNMESTMNPNSEYGIKDVGGSVLLMVLKFGLAG